MPQRQPQQTHLLRTIQYSVQPPTAFMEHHGRQLLPNWLLPVGSVLVMLQQTPVALLDRTGETESQKDLMRQRCLSCGEGIAAALRQSAHCAALFDPRTGFPVGTGAGELRLDDVAVVRSLLGYAIVEQGGCSIILHPQWGGAVYPSVLLSSASPQTVEQVVQSLQSREYWQPAPVAPYNYVKR